MNIVQKHDAVFLYYRNHKQQRFGYVLLENLNVTAVLMEQICCVILLLMYFIYTRYKNMCIKCVGSLFEELVAGRFL